MEFLRISTAAVLVLLAGAAGVRIATASVRTGFAMTGYKRDGIFYAFRPQQFLYFLPLPQGNRRSAAGGGYSEAISRKCPDWRP